jgi:PEP-CTERM motif
MTSRGLARMVFTTFLLSGPPCWAIPVTVDQFYIPTAVPHNGLLAEDTQTVAQTFTVGLAGRLTALELELACCLNAAGQITFPTEDLLIEIRTTLSDGSPSDHVVASTTASSTDLSIGSFRFERFALGHDGFFVSPGELYAVVLTSMAPGMGRFNPYTWGRDAFGQYDRGSAYVAFPHLGGEFFVTVSDMGFKTYVDPIPEPATFTLVALGAAALARARIVQRRRARTNCQESGNEH